MELDSILEKRRSIRSYKADGKVSREALELMLKAAQAAPSWKNSQTGRYYIVIEAEKLKEITETCLPEFNQKNSENAAALIITAFEKNIAGFMPDKTPANELGNEWGAYDLGLQNGNFILKASELGYDTLIMGIRNEKILRDKLNIPDSQEIASVIALGVRQRDVSAPERKNLDEIAKFF